MALANLNRSQFTRTIALALAGLVGFSWWIVGPPTQAHAEPRPHQLPAATRAQCLAELRAALKSEEFWPSMHAAEALTLAGHGAEVRAALPAKLATETDDQRRCGLARELVRAGDRSQTKVLLGILASPNPHGHIHACESLFKVGEIGDGRALREAARPQQDGRLRIMALAALSRCGHPTALDSIRQFLKSDNPDLQRLAAWVLTQAGDKSDIPALQELAKQTSAENVRSACLLALAVLGDEQGQQALATYLESSDPAQRIYAANFAGDATATGCVPQLVKLLNDENIDVRVRAAQSLLTLFPDQTLSDSPDPPQKVVTAQPSPDGVTRIPLLPSAPGNPRNSEGDFIRLHDGRLLLVYTHFVGGAGDHAEAYLAGRFSTDGGRSWTAKDVQIVPNEAGQNVMSVSLLRLADGRIALFYLQKNSQQDCRPVVRFSTDEAQTWSEPVGMVPDAQVGYYVLNNDRVIQLRSGRLVAPLAQHFGPGQAKWTGQGKIVCYLSDDAGQTWKRGALAEANDATPNLALQEPGVVELNDGRVLMFCRTNAGSQYLGTSADEGETWSNLEASALISPVSPATIERIPATGDLLAVWNDVSEAPPEARTKRTPLTAALSEDDGRTWRTVKQLETNPHGWFCYTAIDFVGPNVVLMHCSGDRRHGNGLADSQISHLPIVRLYRKE